GDFINGISSGIRASKLGLDFWSGEGTFDSPFNNSLTGLGDEIEYSNESAREFSNSHTELKRLSSNVDNLYADGSTPANYSSKDGQIFNSIGQRVNGATSVKSSGFLGVKKEISVFL